MSYDLGTWPAHESPYTSKMNPIAIVPSKDKMILNRLLSHKHMLETIERVEWLNLPPELNSDLIERVLYFRFKGAMFKYNDKFYFLPFALDGDIDSYGRYIGINPVLFTGTWLSEDKKDISFMSGVKFKTVYSKAEANTELGEVDSLVYNDKAVILTDSSLEISQDFSPMSSMISPLIEQLTDILVLVNMDLISSAKAFYVVARDAEQKLAIEKEFEDLDRRILSGKRVTVVTSDTDLRELTGSTSKDSARYFQTYQSIDNLRKDIIGGSNGGTFMKQEHTTEAETSINSNTSSLVLSNIIRMRKEFCEIVNSVWGLNIDVRPRGQAEEGIVGEESSQTEQLRGDDNEI